MRAASSTLIAYLLSREANFSVDLFTFSLLDGSIHRWTSGDFDVTSGGVLFSAAGPAIQRSRWSVKNTTEVPELEIKLFSTGTDFAAGNLKALIHDGLLDGAVIQLERAFMPSYGDTSLGAVTLFGGRSGRVEINGLGATIICVSSNVLMQQYMPRNTFQLGCIHTLYDSGCTLDRAVHTMNYTVSAANQTVVNFAESPVPDSSIWLLGTLTILDGAGAGQRRGVLDSADTGVRLSYPLLAVPSPGDHFTLTQGCNKTTARCTVLSNIANYRGFPTIPPAAAGI